MPAMVFYIVRGARENRLTDWLLAGVFSALALLGKYSAGIVLPGCLAYILSDRERRKCFLKPGLWLGVLTGVLLLLPLPAPFAANSSISFPVFLAPHRIPCSSTRLPAVHG